MSEEVYVLEFLFDGSGLDEDTLRREIKDHDAIDLEHDEAPEVTVEQEPSLGTNKCIRLSIEGPLEKVSQYHYHLRHGVTDQHTCILLRDDAGNELRQEAYPILGEIERALRTFINRAMTEIGGFDWWETYAPIRTRKAVEGMQKTCGIKDHPLELTYFYELMDFVIGSVRQWGEEEPLSPGHLAELLEGCNSVDDLRNSLNERTRVISLWDEVFVRYYEEEKAKERWRNLKEIVGDPQGKVREIRNAVMHHRPVFPWQIRVDLPRAKEEVLSLILLSRKRLPEEEREAARQTSTQWAHAIAQTALQTEDTARALAEAARWAEGVGHTAVRAALQAEEIGYLLAQGILRAEEIGRTIVQAALRAEEARPDKSHMPYVGSEEGTRFHRPSCRYVNRIASQNLLFFASREGATTQGYSPCGVCKP